MARACENAGFICGRCGTIVAPLTDGSYRNHCPTCLFSKHVDVLPGDRAAHCHALMAPVALRVGRKGWQLVHRCARCGVRRVNRVARDTRQPDDLDEILRLPPE